MDRRIVTIAVAGTLLLAHQVTFAVDYQDLTADLAAPEVPDPDEDAQWQDIAVRLDDAVSVTVDISSVASLGEEALALIYVYGFDIPDSVSYGPPDGLDLFDIAHPGQRCDFNTVAALKGQVMDIEVAIGIFDLVYAVTNGLWYSEMDGKLDYVYADASSAVCSETETLEKEQTDRVRSLKGFCGAYTDYAVIPSAVIAAILRVGKGYLEGLVRDCDYQGAIIDSAVVDATYDSLSALNVNLSTHDANLRLVGDAVEEIGAQFRYVSVEDLADTLDSNDERVQALALELQDFDGRTAASLAAIDSGLADQDMRLDALDASILALDGTLATHDAAVHSEWEDLSDQVSLIRARVNDIYALLNARRPGAP